MLHNQKIIFVSIVDNQSNTVPDLGLRIWDHECLIDRLLKREVCLMGRKTYDITKWKGSNTWVITRNKNLRIRNINIIYDTDDLHLHTEGPIYVLGGTSLFKQLENCVDEIHMYIANNKDGTEDWISIDMNKWTPTNFKNEGIWSYALLIKKKPKTFAKKSR